MGIGSDYLLVCLTSLPFVAFLFVRAPHTATPDDIACSALIWILLTYFLTRICLAVGDSTPTEGLPVKSWQNRHSILRLLIAPAAISLLLTISSLGAGAILKWVVPILWASELILNTAKTLAWLFALITFLLFLAHTDVEQAR